MTDAASPDPSNPRAADGSLAFRAVARLGELPDGGAKLVHVDGRPVGLFRRGDEVFAFDNRCPHAGAPLSRGLVKDDYVSCPMHHWRFRLADGARLDGPRRPNARSFRARVVDRIVEVELPAADARDADGGEPGTA